MNPSLNQNRRGFTLLEIMAASAVSLVVIGSAMGILSACMGSYAQGNSGSELELSARKVLNRIGEDLRSGLISAIVPTIPAESRTVSIFKAARFDDGVVVPEDSRVGYDFRADPADPPNGVDDDRDGRVDEGRVVRTAGGVETVIAENVKDLRFTINGYHLTCTITLEKTVRGTVNMTFSDQVQIRLRN